MTAAADQEVVKKAKEGAVRVKEEVETERVVEGRAAVAKVTAA
jgi:hypothetical protein